MNKTFNIGKYITVYKTDKDDSIPNSATISWASIGSVSISDTELFLQDLQDAITKAKSLIK